MQIIPKTDNFLNVKLTEPFEIYFFENTPQFLTHLKSFIGIPNATFVKQISVLDGLILRFDMHYTYLEDLLFLRRNLNRSHKSDKTFVG